jgi:2-polyprenyl-6-hydroxyphenyl methylase/3-demethylubiquinone-9 3-methyltransferase
VRAASADADPFSFGRNWNDFLEQGLDAEGIEAAKSRTAEFLGLQSLAGLSFLDIGCGSGLFSYVAHALGAGRVVSFDVDPLSVACCRRLRERAGNPDSWEVFEGSILDPRLAGRIAPADVVYSWGVLHHTGDMWSAVRAAAGLVKPGGLFFIAIYNKVEYDTLNHLRGSHGWLRVKRAYNRSGTLGRRLMEATSAAKDVASWLLTLRNPVREISRYKQKRGMSWWHDIVDWLGGYPYEFATAAEIFNFCHGELGLQLERMKTVTSIGCNEFLFLRPRESTAALPMMGRR